MGFDFVRLPLDYRLWIVYGDYHEIKENVLSEIDQAVDLGKKYGIHTDISFHRAPGYCVHCLHGLPKPLNLWRDEEALEACEYHWRLFAKRYRGISSSQVSLNLVNEPIDSDVDKDHGTDLTSYKQFVERMLRVIRDMDPDRLVIADGLVTSRLCYEPVPRIDDPLFGQSFHMYEPVWITHLGASWAMKGYEEQPRYPGMAPKLDDYLAKLSSDSLYRRAYRKYLDVKVDRVWLENQIKPYLDLRKDGKFVHCGELGVFNEKVDRQSQLNWFRDVFDILTKHNIGWAQWDFGGAFGVINTGREEFHSEILPNGDCLDRELLDLIRSCVEKTS